MLILVKIIKKTDFGQNFKKSRFWSKFTKISNLVKILEKSRFWSKLSEILDFSQNLQKCRFWTKLKKMLIIVKIFKKNVDLGQNLQISGF